MYLPDGGLCRGGHRSILCWSRGAGWYVAGRPGRRGQVSRPGGGWLLRLRGSVQRMLDHHFALVDPEHVGLYQHAG
jgi:hypothetical protein